MRLLFCPLFFAFCAQGRVPCGAGLFVLDALSVARDQLNGFAAPANALAKPANKNFFKSFGIKPRVVVPLHTSIRWERCQAHTTVTGS